MNHKSVFATMLIAAMLMIDLASTASAYYDPEQGRFISRDPINTVNQPHMAVAQSPDLLAAYPRVGQIAPAVNAGPVRIGGVAAPQPQGRTIKRDPIEKTPYADGMNLYAYVGNSPLNYVDPSGLFRFGDLLPGLVGGDHSVGISNLLCARKIGRTYFNELGGGIHHEEPQDSFLHCLVSCEIAKHCGQAVARLAGRVQESGNDWETHRDTQDDEVANSYGRNCAKGKKKKCIDCYNCCEKGFFYPNGRYRH